jgi:hypothetical protein
MHCVGPQKWDRLSAGIDGVEKGLNDTLFCHGTSVMSLWYSTCWVLEEGTELVVVNILLTDIN